MAANELSTTPPSPREETEQRFLDAAERLLIQNGYAGVTTRRLAEEAGANHGLVHYYFGSMEELFFQVLERFTSRLITRQRAMYASDVPYIERWRRAIEYLDADRPYQKVWWELQAMAWNRPEFRARIEKVHAAWCDAMHDAVAEAVARYRIDGVDMSAEGWVALIATINEGIILERLSGITRGHDELLGAIDRWLSTLEENAARRERKTRSPRKRKSER